MMDRLASRALQDSALPKISPPGTVPTPEESDLESVKMLNSESPHQHGSFLPLLGTESEANHLFKASSRAWQAKGSCLPTPPPILAGTLVTQEGGRRPRPTPRASLGRLPGTARRPWGPRGANCWHPP
ncbi:kinesin-like protein KIF19 [Bos indicus x Bos taurus]|uniref:kinesin-like protein KIF19 n=1 Tax=Bos indicus x Bos taurus TaxID=30522 RepID=UPI000F7D4452|nr:kinesin-like protein KIF19 [Bos indicus x Bos taurus]